MKSCMIYKYKWMVHKFNLHQYCWSGPGRKLSIISSEKTGWSIDWWWSNLTKACTFCCRSIFFALFNSNFIQTSVSMWPSGNGFQPIEYLLCANEILSKSCVIWMKILAISVIQSFSLLLYIIFLALMCKASDIIQSRRPVGLANK